LAATATGVLDTHLVDVSALNPLDWLAAVTCLLIVAFEPGSRLAGAISPRE
jgi:hypothetical protein